MLWWLARNGRGPFAPFPDSYSGPTIEKLAERVPEPSRFQQTSSQALLLLLLLCENPFFARIFDQTFQDEERPLSIIFLNFPEISWLWIFYILGLLLGLLLIIYEYLSTVVKYICKNKIYITRLVSVSYSIFIDNFLNFREISLNFYIRIIVRIIINYLWISWHCCKIYLENIHITRLVSVSYSINVRYVSHRHLRDLIFTSTKILAFNFLLDDKEK